MNTKVLNQANGDNWALYNGDCVPVVASLPDNSIDLAVYSPPYSSLYIYSASECDMGNSDDDAQFSEHYAFVLKEIYRVMRPGRLCAVHVKDLVYYQGSSERGTAGLREFSDQCTALHRSAGFDFHCRITIWRDPVLERSKTNAHGLLWKTFQSDSTFCRVGMPEYLMIYRKWAKEGEESLVKPVRHPKSQSPYDTVKTWQELASEVWPQDDATTARPASAIWNYRPGQSGRGDMDLPTTDVLNVKVARADRDEKHLCPMPLNITARALELWTNPGDVVLSPFAGIGSEGYQSLLMGRKFIGAELKPEYFSQAVAHLQEAEVKSSARDLLSELS